MLIEEEDEEGGDAKVNIKLIIYHVPFPSGPLRRRRRRSSSMQRHQFGQEVEGRKSMAHGFSTTFPPIAHTMVRMVYVLMGSGGIGIVPPSSLAGGIVWRRAIAVINDARPGHAGLRAESTVGRSINEQNKAEE